MRLNSEDLRNASFTKGIRGYDTSEVKAFLGSLAEQIDRMCVDLEDSGKRVTSLTAELKNYRNMDQKMRDTLENAQDSSHDTMVSAEREAKICIKEAELSAEKI